MTHRDANHYNRLLLALCAEISARLRAVRRPRWSSIEKHLRVLLAVVTFLTLTLTVMHREDSDGYQATHLFFIPRRNWEMDQGRGMLYEPEYYSRMDQAVLLEEINGLRFTSALESEYGAYEAYDNYDLIETAALPPPRPSAEKTAAYRDWLTLEQADYTSWFMRTRASYAEWLAGRTQSFEGWLATRSNTYQAAYAEELAFQEQAAQLAGPQAGEPDNSRGKRTQGGTVRRAPHAPAYGSNTLPVDSTQRAQAVISWHYAGIDLAYPLPGARRDDTPTPPPRILTSI
jgi:hypothetical protein